MEENINIQQINNKNKILHQKNNYLQYKINKIINDNKFIYEFKNLDFENFRNFSDINFITLKI
jgi:uncharacterized protein YpmB